MYSHIYTCQNICLVFTQQTATATSIKHIHGQEYRGGLVPAAEYLSMQHAHPEIAVQTLNAFQAIVIHPKYLQVDLHVMNGQNAGQCWSPGAAGAAGMPCLSRAVAGGSCTGLSGHHNGWHLTTETQQQGTVCCPHKSVQLNPPTFQSLPSGVVLQKAETSTCAEDRHHAASVCTNKP